MCGDERHFFRTSPPEVKLNAADGTNIHANFQLDLRRGTLYKGSPSRATTITAKINSGENREFGDWKSDGILHGFTEAMSVEGLCGGHDGLLRLCLTAKVAHFGESVHGDKRCPLIG
jgi:hypothetical protein